MRDKVLFYTVELPETSALHLNLYFNKSEKILTLMQICMDLYPAIHSDADPDPVPATQNYVDPCGSGSATFAIGNIFKLMT
jgi:hypothetical protein